MPSLTTPHLHVRDSRTEAEYTVPIHDDSYILAKDVAAISSTDSEGQARQLHLLDHGYQSTACMTSAIAHLDGPRGQLTYRGIEVEKLFYNNDFEDTMYLLIWGSLPSEEQKKAARVVVNEAAIPPKSVIDVVCAFPIGTEMYPMIMAGMSAFVSVDETATAARHTHKPMYHGNLPAADQALLRAIGYFAATVGLAYCHKHGRKFTNPDPDRSLISNLLLMMGRLDPGADPASAAGIEKCLNKLWILYADHGMSNSTAGMLHSASTLADPASCMITGIVCAWGPLHGGAIPLVFEALEKIKSPRNVPAYIDAIKANKGRLFGYGHRIYKARDPRLSLLEELIGNEHKAIESSPLMQVALAIDDVAKTDEYFVSRKLNANLDLLAAFLYSALGFEQDAILAIIALSRAPGTMAHWRESLTQPMKIWRPQQVYVGPRKQS